MRLATFNLENLDLPPNAGVPLEVRAEVLRPGLERLQADILCLQEVNAQHVHGRAERAFAALDQLLTGTRYAGYHRVSTTAGRSHGAADVHNLVTLSRLPIRGHRELRHELVDPPLHKLKTAVPASDSATEWRFDRPFLSADIELPGGELATIINVHLKAPIASSIAGQKLEPFVWKTVGGWAEGYYLSALGRAAQALEIRFVIDQLFDADKHRLIAVAGDFNAEDHEVALRIVIGAAEDTGNAALSARSLVLLDRALPEDRRWSVLHHGRPQMLDHILASHALQGRFKSIEVHNEAMGDELAAYGRHLRISSSYHAAVVSEFVDGLTV